MPPLGTPSPFRVPSQRRDAASASASASRSTTRRGPGLAFHTPVRANSRSQFAATPRFIFGSDQGNDNDEIDGSDQDESSSPFAHRIAGSGPVPRRKDTIEDSEDDENHPSRSANRRSLQKVDVETDIDAQFDVLFPPTPDRSKRRRVSSLVSDDDEVQQQQLRPRASRADSICSSSSSGPPSPSAAEGRQGSSSPFSDPRPTDQGATATETPAPFSQKTAARMQTPMPPSSSTKTPFRSHPRFVFSASHSLQTGSSTPSATADTPSSLQQRKRPNFILPRSPSPDADGSPPPALFSPTSHRLHRRGRPRAVSPNYLPGGLAAEVRSWILEMGMKREQQQQQQQRPHNTQSASRYLFTARVDSCSHSMLSSGPMILTRAHLIDSKQDPEGTLQSERLSRNILLLGAPTSHQRAVQNNNPPSSSSSPSTFATTLKSGDVIGVSRGLTWEIDLDKEFLQGQGQTDHHHTASQVILDNESAALNALSPGNDNQQSSTITPGKDKETEKWLVAAEWDLLVKT
ncbi:hypothetical protein VTN77DRAFT_9801 [Rasamsonia byssochlamydoides]|uniref:uncharacterized protein n=1 Tax=Rasamsonia byssochlamydoides TaxID=89139 RepID=UPI0037425A37